MCVCVCVYVCVHKIMKRNVRNTKKSQYYMYVCVYIYICVCVCVCAQNDATECLHTRIVA